MACAIPALAIPGLTYPNRLFYNVSMTGPADTRPTPGVTAPLEFQPPDAIAVSERLSLLFEGQRVVYFAFTVPFASHRADDKRARNFCIAQCASVQLASQAELARAFKLHPRTVLRAVQRLQSEGQSGFAKPFKLRRHHGIEDPELLRQAAQMLADGSGLRETARALKLCYSTLRNYKLKGLLPHVQAADQPQLEPAPEPQAEPAEEPRAESAEEPQAEPAEEPSEEPRAEPAAEPTPGQSTRPGWLADPSNECGGTPEHARGRGRRDQRRPRDVASRRAQSTRCADAAGLRNARPARSPAGQFGQAG